MNREQYVKEYYEKCYADGSVDKEIQAVGTFLAEHAKGKVLDCGCGPVPQLWAIYMSDAKEIHAVDFPQESIDFVKHQLATRSEWYRTFETYQKIVEKFKGKLPEDYIIMQLDKIKSVNQADMTQALPFLHEEFDTVLSLYSLGVLKEEDALDSAIKNISRVLKKGGKLLHVNTDGKNANSILPEYTWQGLPQASEILTPLLKKYGFGEIDIHNISLQQGLHSMYVYGKLSLLSAIKI